MEDVQFQLEAFKKLVYVVNQIPGIEIDLHKDIDRQRDALAFMIDSLYRQFKGDNWQLVLEDMIKKIKEWNTPRDALKASSAILSFIRHLYELRIVEILNDSSLTDSDRQKIQATYKLYTLTIESVLKKNLPGKPVSLSGIPEDFLPDWYRTKLYLT